MYHKKSVHTFHKYFYKIELCYIFLILKMFIMDINI